MSNLRSDASEGCMWCGGTGRLETYTAEGEIDESTQCVCILNYELKAALALVPDGELARYRIWQRQNEAPTVYSGGT